MSEVITIGASSASESAATANNVEGVPETPKQDALSSAIPSKRVKVEQDANDIHVEIENTSEMKATYVRTRHKNVRCFPRCSATHKNKSFCGNSLYLTIKGRVFKKEDVIVLGEFRNVRVQPSFAINQDVETTEFGEAFTEGVLLKQEDDVMSFAINPIRKWKFDGKLRPMDHYVFTVYILVEGKVLAFKDTPSFSLMPIWKTEGGKEEEGEEEEEVEHVNKSPVRGNPAPAAVQLTSPSPPPPPPPLKASPPTLTVAPHQFVQNRTYNSSPQLGYPSNVQPSSFTVRSVPVSSPNPMVYSQMHSIVPSHPASNETDYFARNPRIPGMGNPMAGSSIAPRLSSFQPQPSYGNTLGPSLPMLPASMSALNQMPQQSLSVPRSSIDVQLPWQTPQDQTSLARMLQHSMQPQYGYPTQVPQLIQNRYAWLAAQFATPNSMQFDNNPR